MDQGQELFIYIYILNVSTPFSPKLRFWETMSMARLLGSDAHLVSYGAMSKQPLSLLTSLFI
ncbi:hypothetical protein PILCRDRAFT_812350 [Piloderma croceum F 1598]|uniref:Uncharacterized protein n=1 Tax=Piloderma croceum (strain F 1598) TaxID=765440 RepID=A0A0C3G2P3_PILCF|nr:hypothetical protein PILCRDRAFT_812350 [Piloderma croceum F 1598]